MTLWEALYEGLPQAFGEHPISTAWWMRPKFFKLFMRLFCEVNDLPPETVRGMVYYDMVDIEEHLRATIPDYEEKLRATVREIAARKLRPNPYLG